MSNIHGPIILSLFSINKHSLFYFFLNRCSINKLSYSNIFNFWPIKIIAALILISFKYLFKNMTIFKVVTVCMLIMVHYTTASCNGDGFLTWRDPIGGSYPSSGKTFTFGISSRESVTDNDYLFSKTSEGAGSSCAWNMYTCKMSLESEVVYTDGTNTTADYNASGATTTHGILFEMYYSYYGSWLKAYVHLESGPERILKMYPYSDVRFVGLCFYANPALA